MLALLSSILWGTSDFVGGTFSRRVPTLVVLGVSQVVATIVLLAYVAGSGAWHGSLGWLGWSVAAGVLWALAMGALYTALATGVMGVVAPLASCGMAVPVVIGVALGDRLQALQVLGILAAIAGVIGTAGPDLRGAGPAARHVRPLLLAGVAALFFGLEIFCVARGSASSVPMTLVGMRLSVLGCLGVALLARRPARTRLVRRDLAFLGVLGCLDLLATVAYAMAARDGLVSVVSVLGSLYPAVTVLLARHLHAERLSRAQIGGVVGVLLGAALLGLGGAAA